MAPALQHGARNIFNSATKKQHTAPKAPFGCGPKLNRTATTGSSPWFYLPPETGYQKPISGCQQAIPNEHAYRTHCGYLFLTQSTISAWPPRLQMVYGPLQKSIDLLGQTRQPGFFQPERSMRHSWSIHVTPSVQARGTRIMSQFIFIYVRVDVHFMYGLLGLQRAQLCCIPLGQTGSLHGLNSARASSSFRSQPWWG